MAERIDPADRIKAMRGVPAPLGVRTNGGDCVEVFYPECDENLLISAGAVRAHRENGGVVGHMPLNPDGPTWIGNGEEERWNGHWYGICYYYGEVNKGEIVRAARVDHRGCLGGDCISKVYLGR